VRREDLRLLFARARDLCHETDYVVFGSLAALGHVAEVPPRMAASLDVDAFSKDDPGRIFELGSALGQGSPFEAQRSPPERAKRSRRTGSGSARVACAGGEAALPNLLRACRERILVMADLRTAGGPVDRDHVKAQR